MTDKADLLIEAIECELGSLARSGGSIDSRIYDVLDSISDQYRRMLAASATDDDFPRVSDLLGVKPPLGDAVFALTAVQDGKTFLAPLGSPYNLTNPVWVQVRD